MFYLNSLQGKLPIDLLNNNTNKICQDYDPAYYITYGVCVLILYMSGETYSLKSIPEDSFFGAFIEILFTLRDFSELPKKYFNI